jgi:hypothetical protein
VRIGRATVRPKAAGKVKVTVKIAKKALKAFRHKKLRVRVVGVFTPSGGTPLTRTKRVTLHSR